MIDPHTLESTLPVIQVQVDGQSIGSETSYSCISINSIELGNPPCSEIRYHLASEMVVVFIYSRDDQEHNVIVDAAFNSGISVDIHTHTCNSQGVMRL
jgi:hypothetical protein